MSQAKPIVRVQAGSSNVSDGLMNVISGAGTRGDRQTAARYKMGYVDPYQVESAYVTSGLCKKIHDIPPFEMTREQRDWQAGDTQIENLEILERRLGVWDKVRDALSSARLFGGAVIIMGLPGRPEQPARAAGRDALKYLTVMSRHQITVGPLERDLMNPLFGQPTYYEITSAGQGQRIHPSRVIPFIGQKRPAGSMFSNNGHEFWGDPLLLSIEMAVKNNDGAYQNVAQLMSEAKVDTITSPNLTQNLATAEYEGLLSRRMQVATLFQSVFNTRLIDGGDGSNGEKWETRQINFAGLPEVLRSFGVFLSAVVDIPYTRLFGESPGGMNSTGKGEQEDFAKMIRSLQNVLLRPALDRLDEYLIPSALGSRPKDVYWTFAPLSTLDEKTDAEVGKLDMEGLKIAVDGGLIPSEVASEAVKNRLIEGGRFPGIEKAYSDYDAGLLVPDVPEDEPDANVVPLAVAANDALPRPLYVQRKLINTSEFIAWAKGQGFKTVTDAGDLHVTVTFSRTPVDWMKMGEAWSGEKGEMTVNPGGARIVEALGDKGAVVLLFNSSELSWRHMAMRENGASWDYQEYQPHVTITYDGSGVDLSKVEPYRGKLVFGPEIFEELTDDWRPKES